MEEPRHSIEELVLAQTSHQQAGHAEDDFHEYHVTPTDPPRSMADDHALRIHDLRQACATMLISRGVHPKAIQHHLWHANINITMDRYGPLLPDQFSDVAAQLDAAHKQGTD